MKLLVKFIAVDNKEKIDDNYYYIHEIYKSINSAGLIKSLNIDPAAEALGAGAVREIDDEGNLFLLEFNSKDENKSNIWTIYFVYGTYNNSKQVEISIYSDTYIPKADEMYLEKLKLRIKKCLSRDWKKIIWLVDKDSECLSICLYPMIYKVENLMREVINEVMTKQYGTSWWDTFASADIKQKHLARLREYKSKVPAFNDVDERLMSIDIDDLGDLVKFKRYRWNPIFSETISACINGVSSYNDNSVKEELKKQRVVETDLWAEQFSKYLSEDFNEKYAIFTKDRNHIMHNKLIDRAAFRTIKELVEWIEGDLEKAINKIQNEILSNEEKFEIEKQKTIERQMLKEVDHECRENDANVSIRDSDEIEKLFEESIDKFLDGVEEKLRFRNDIEIITEYERMGYEGKLFSVESKIDNVCLKFSFNMIICDSEGSDSILEFCCNNRDFQVSIEYRNGAVEYDDDSGLYMPITEDEIDEVDSIIDDIVDFINMELPSYLEIANPDDIAEYLICSECETESICINENILPIGTCMNCGYVNEVHECDSCHLWFNSEEGRVIEDFSFCENCLRKIED